MKTKKSKKFFWILVAIASLILLGFLIYFLTQQTNFLSGNVVGIPEPPKLP